MERKPMMRATRVLRVAVMAGAMALAAGCDLTELTLEERAKEELSFQRRRWETSDITSYRYLLQVDCDCGAAQERPVVIEVRNGQTVDVRYHDDGAPADRQLFARFDTVDDLFTLIDQALRSDGSSVAVLYEHRYSLGYPESVLLDYSEFVKGDELGFVMLDDLEILDD
jgi:hypothetical protein